MQEPIQKVCVTINDENLEINATRVFYGRNPVTNLCSVNFMDVDSKKWIRLFWMGQEEADLLVKKIREGEITDLTGYQAKWNL